MQGLLPVRLLPRLGPLSLWLGVLFCGALVIAALWLWIEPIEGANRGSLLRRFRAPGVDGYVLGSDQLGRSVLLRAASGIPWSIGIAAVATAISLGLGTLLGLIGAMSTGWLRAVVRNLVDTVIAFPSLVIAIVVIALVGRGFWPTALVLGLATWPIVARVVFAEAQSVLKRDYVTAAEFLGVSRIAILRAHVLPALRPTLLVMGAFTFADMLIIESALSFLGLGAPISVPTWGNMLADSRQFLANAPWMMLVPGACIAFAAVALNLLGDGVAQAARRRAREIEL